nr:hypothetical protein RAR13_04460 [Aminobacter aminovorans]
MGYASTTFTRMSVGTIVLLLLCGAATAADTGVGSRPDGPSFNNPGTDLPPASDITRCNTVLSNPQAFETDLLELCKLLRSLTKPRRLQQPPVELT